ncbi:MAG: serine/threonine-protein kinase [Nannocystaceae bacterium]|nr:serine/threonine protein kinase [Myxococcales bacterium]
MQKNEPGTVNDGRSGAEAIAAPKPAAVVRLRDSRYERAGKTRPPSSETPGSEVGRALRDPNEGGAASPNSDPEDLTGTTVGGRYKLMRLLDRGGMGYIYYAKHTAIDKRLAIKVLSLKCARSENHRTRLLREARACSQIAHENVVDILDFGQTPNGSVFIAMELLQGETLAAMIDRESPIGWARAKPIILQVCRALHAAHSKGILHRDVKPDNCWRTKRGANKDFVKVYDFGLAKLLQDDSFAGTKPITSAGTIFGTPEYMSPEQARGEPTDHRSDLYSAAIILYELLTGTVPFVAENFIDVLAMQATDLPRSPRKLAPEGAVSKQLEAVILKGLAKDPKDRFQSMQEFATALAELPVHEGQPLRAVTGERAVPRQPTPPRPISVRTPTPVEAVAEPLPSRSTASAVGSLTRLDVVEASPGLRARERVYLTVIVTQAIALVILAIAFASQVLD